MLNLSSTDGLTCIANRRRFDVVLESEWHRALRAGGLLSLALIDVDWFKKYIDHYGHQAGDDCLRSVANTLKAHALRVGDLVARYGEEEFVIICATTDKNQMMDLAQKLCRSLADLALPHKASPFCYVSVSIGVAVLIPMQHKSTAYLLKKADGPFIGQITGAQPDGSYG